jgi:aquaporin Z
LVFPDSLWLGTTFPAVGTVVSFSIELILTFFLVLVILRVSAGGSQTKIIAGFVIGSMVCLAALAAGPLTGASMNPVRSLAPAVAILDFKNLWIYLTAPFIGGLLAVFIDHYLQVGD